MKIERIAAILLGIPILTGGAYIAQPFGVEDAASGGTAIIPGAAVGTPTALFGLAMIGWGLGMDIPKLW